MSEPVNNVPTASQTVGPFFSIGMCPRCPNHLLPAAEAAGAQLITVSGRVIDGDGQGVPDALLEVWRANENGVFAVSNDSGAQDAYGVPSGFARIPTNDRGEFEFRTLKPGPLKGSGPEVHAPHLVVIIFMRGLLRHLLTRIYFPQEPLNEHDAVLKLVPADRRSTLIARPAADGTSDLQWNVRLQGDTETVFFEA